VGKLRLRMNFEQAFHYRGQARRSLCVIEHKADFRQSVKQGPGLTVTGRGKHLAITYIAQQTIEFVLTTALRCGAIRLYSAVGRAAMGHE
jgi:hypothetical protein